MKKISIKADRIINSILAGALSLLGFTSCDDPASPDDDDIICMYGTPTGYYEIKGTVTEESGQAVEGAKVIMRHIYNNGTYTAWSDTVVTDDKGSYLLKSAWSGNKIRVVCKPEGNTLEADSTDMTVAFKGGDGAWNLGTAKETVDFRLKFKK